MKTISVAQFRANTRELLNEALREPVRIKRYNEVFEIKAVHLDLTPKPTPLEVTREAVKNKTMPNPWKPRKPITKKDQTR